MKLKCEFCGAIISDTDAKCGNCGAANAHVKTLDKRPHTIAELTSWYVSQKLPPEEITRFFIGKNYTGARAFGIFKDANNLVTVYKNKNDGSRVIHYQGGDEDYAVNEIYLKLKDKIASHMRR